jgi:hypothetical protein
MQPQFNGKWAGHVWCFLLILILLMLLLSKSLPEQEHEQEQEQESPHHSELNGCQVGVRGLCHWPCTGARRDNS